MKRITTLALLTSAVALNANAEYPVFDAAPVASASIEYQIDRWSDEYIQTGCKKRMNTNIRWCVGENPQAVFRIGLDFAFGPYKDHWQLPVMQFGFKHRSHWFSGAPFNDDYETASNAVYLEFKIGGLR